MSRLGAGPNTQLFCMGPSPPAGPEEWGGWGQQENAALRKGALLLEGTQPGMHPARRAAGLAGSNTGAARKPTGRRRDPEQPAWAQGIHSNVGSCSWARGRGKSQHRGLCVSKSLFQGLKLFPLNAAILQINTLGFPTLLISASRNVPKFLIQLSTSPTCRP